MRDIWPHFKIRPHCTEDASPLVILAHTPRIFTPRLKARLSANHAACTRAHVDAAKVWASLSLSLSETWTRHPPLFAFSCLIATAVHLSWEPTRARRDASASLQDSYEVLRRTRARPEDFAASLPPLAPRSRSECRLKALLKIHTRTRLRTFFSRLYD